MSKLFELKLPHFGRSDGYSCILLRLSEVAQLVRMLAIKIGSTFA
jgi:hypothetical protein